MRRYEKDLRHDFERKLKIQLSTPLTVVRVSVMDKLCGLEAI